MRKLILISLLIGLVLSAQFAKLGKLGMKFLDISLDARAVALGEAYSSLVEGPSAVFWNPAGLSLSKGINLFFGYSNWWVGIMHGGISGSYNLGILGNIAAFYSGIHSGWLERTTPENQSTGDSVYYYAYQLGLSYSRFLTDRFSFGVSVKILRELYPSNDSGGIQIWGGGLDIGGLYVSGFRDLKIGLSLLNFGPDTRPSGKYDDWVDGSVDTVKSFKDYPIPMIFKGGISMRIYEIEGFKVIGAFDISSPEDNITRYCIGVENKLVDMLSIRIGYEFGRNDQILALNAGLGINVGKLNFDYAFSDGGILPYVHRVSLKMGF